MILTTMTTMMTTTTATTTTTTITIRKTRTTTTTTDTTTITTTLLDRSIPTLLGHSLPLPLSPSTATITTTITITTNTTTTTLPVRSIPTLLNPSLPSNLITSSTMSPYLSPLSPTKLNLSPSTSCQLRSSPTAITRQFRNQPTGEQAAMGKDINDEKTNNAIRLILN